jgi:alanine dehydrogenase
MTAPIWITERDVVDLLDLRDAIAALESGLRAQAHGYARNMTKTQLGLGHSNLHALGAIFANERLAATKTWMHTDGGATPLLVLIDADNGAIRAIIEAFALGQMRTGGIAGLATDWLAHREADDMALIGTGKQALLQVAAVNAVRPLRRLRVFSPNPASRATFAAQVQREFGFEVVVAQSVAAAVESAPIVTLVTRASSPFLDATLLAQGAHMNAVGAIGPDREEFAQDVFNRVTCMAVDTLPAVQDLSKEFRTRFGAAGPAWDAVLPLSNVIADGVRRSAGDDITLFKAMGMGISDLALAVEIFRRATHSGRGHPFAHPQRAKPRIHAERVS